MTFPQLPEERSASLDQRIESLEMRYSDLSSEDEVALTELTAELSRERAALAQAQLRNSAAGRVGVLLEDVTSVAGFDWRTNIALIGGIAAKEVIVSTLGTAYSLGEVGAEEATSLGERLANDPEWSPLRAMSLILFILLYAPCFVTVVAIAREAGSWGWAAFSVVFNTLFAFGVAAGVYQVGRLFL
jgi:ferrous iron transport protein B